MRLFSEKVSYTSTNSTYNILQVEDFSEIFFGVYEIEINKNKYPVEKISEQNGNPVVSIPVTVEGVKSYYPFVLSKGKFEVLFNKNNSDNNLNSEPLLIGEQVIEEQITYPQDVVEEYYVTPEYKNTQILEKIERAKEKAKRELKRIKIENTKALQNESLKREKRLEKTLNEARENLVDEFVSISKNIKNELISENDNRFGEINETIDNKISDLSNSLLDSLQEDFSKSSEAFDKTIKELVKESYLTLQPKIDKELTDIATEIVEKVDSIEKNLALKLSDKADKVLIENVEGELSAVAKANIDLNNKINKGVNKALSRVGNISSKVDELTIALAEEVDSKISKVEQNIEQYYSEKLSMLEGKTFDLTENVRKSLIELISESKDNLIQEIRKIQNEKPIEYVIESKGKRQVKDFDSFEKEYDKKIKDRVDNEVTRLRRYISVYSGGGSVAMQFADGGTMNGNLTVTGNINGGAIYTTSSTFQDYTKSQIFKNSFNNGINTIQTFPINTNPILSTVKLFVTFFNSTKKTVCEAYVMYMDTNCYINVYSIINSDNLNPLMLNMNCGVVDGFLNISATTSNECVCVINGIAVYVDDVTGMLFGTEGGQFQFGNEIGDALFSLE